MAPVKMRLVRDACCGWRLEITCHCGRKTLAEVLNPYAACGWCTAEFTPDVSDLVATGTA